MASSFATRVIFQDGIASNAILPQTSLVARSDQFLQRYNYENEQLFQSLHPDGSELCGSLIRCWTGVSLVAVVLPESIRMVNTTVTGLVKPVKSGVEGAPLRWLGCATELAV
jgi:hypothetical protein